MNPGEVANLFDKLPSRDQRVLGKIIERMIEWNLSFPRAISNATTLWKNDMTGSDVEFESFEQSLDWWIDAGKRYG